MGQYDAAELAGLFASGRNVMEWLREQEKAGANTPTTILYSYDVQAGSYTAAAADPAVARLKDAIASRLAPLVGRFGPASILEPGCGEATTLRPLLDRLASPASTDVLAFDLSLSRLLYARRYLGERPALLFAAELETIPLADNSVDVVFTFHAIEPNGGRELPILGELLRVARRGLVLVEPSRDFASEEGRARMDRLGYVRDIPGALSALGSPPALVEPLGLDINPLNAVGSRSWRKPGPPSLPRRCSCRL